MMELQRPDVGVVAAHRAASTRLANDPCSDRPSSLHHRVPTATLAPVGAVAMEDEGRGTVLSARSLERSAARLPTLARLPASGCGLGLKPVSPEPVLEHTDTHAQLGGD